MGRPKAWYAHYPADFMADTRHLTLEERGAYRELLDHHFLHESIPSDIKRLSLILGVSPQKTRKLWQVLSHFFQEKDGAFYNRRMQREIAKAADISEKRQAASNKRWNANADANGNANADTTHNSQLTIKKKPTVRTAARFDDWWDAFANKKNRKGALKIWKSRGLDAIADRLIADAEKRHKSDGQWLRGFQPHPTTYLNGDRWEDEIEPPHTNGSKQLSDSEMMAIAQKRGISTHGLSREQLKARIEARD